jgi:hypothetical protein
LAGVKTCIIIHTLISFVKDRDEDREFTDELVQEGTDAPGDVVRQAYGEPSDTQRETWGQTKHTELKQMLFEDLYV